MLNIINKILSLSRISKRIIVVLNDLFLCIFSTYFAFYLRLGELIPITNTFNASLISILILLPIFTFRGLYKVIFRHSGWISMKSVSQAIFIYGIIYFIIILVIGVPSTPRTIGFIQPSILFFLIISSRLFVSMIIVEKNINKNKNLRNGLIFGTGSNARKLYSTLENSTNFKIFGYLDKNKNLHGQILNGLKIFYPDKLGFLIDKYNISVVFLSDPSITREKRNKIIEFISKFNVAVRTIPDFNDIAEGKINSISYQDFDVDDLLGRNSVMPDKALMNNTISNQTILVTGAGGSIGSELVKQIIIHRPKTILLLDKNEFNLYDINSHLSSLVENRSDLSKINIIPILGSINNSNFLLKVFDTWSIDIVYHAAAYKHVPLVEYNVINSINNNVFGTLSLAKISIQKKVNNFIFISTDKAVRPKNLMGTSKRLAEICLQSLDEDQVEEKKTIFSIVRFGNVLKSSGSVIPKFRKQIIEGGPVTVTHTEITRYFMTLNEAAQLVIQAGAMSTGGEVFVLDMGDPVKIYDLASKMIKLSGFTIKNQKNNPKGDIEIKIIGLRPGEKLYEELLIGNNPSDTSHQKIKKAKENFIIWKKLKTKLIELEEAVNNYDLNKVINILDLLVEEYIPTKDIEDLIYRSNSKLN